MHHLRESCKQLFGCRLSNGGRNSVGLDVDHVLACGLTCEIQPTSATIDLVGARASPFRGVVLEAGFGGCFGRLARDSDLCFAVKVLGKFKSGLLSWVEVVSLAACEMSDHAKRAVCCFLDVYQHFEPLSARFGLAYIIHITPNCMSCQQLFFMFDKTQLYAIFVLWQK